MGNIVVFKNFSNFSEYLNQKNFILLDGATGTLIQKSGVKYDHVPEVLNITHPELIESFHRRYIDAGSDIVYANTFGANAYKLQDSGYSVEEIIGAGVKIARKAVEGTDALVALDIGPIGQLLEPAGSMKFDEAYEYYKQQILAGKDADVIVFETMTDLYELKAAVLAAKENCDKPILTTMTFERNGRTFTGVSPACAAVTLTGLGVDALGVNCSLGPDELEPVVSEMSKYTNLPLVIKANAGLPDPNSNEYNIMPDKFAECVCSLLKYGVKVIGGCCGTNPDYIAKIKSEVADREYQPQTKSVDTTVCSSTTVVEINGPRIIGERINPTGKKLFKQALVENNIDYILTQALSQVQGGAEILDVNVGHPEIDEKKMMVRVLKVILTSRVIDRPIRPLFDESMRNDVSIVCTVMSVDPDCQPEIVAMIGASIAISISDVPWNGPISGCSVGMIDGEYIINPTEEQRKVSQMATTVASTSTRIAMIEAGANCVSDDDMYNAIMAGHEANQKIISFIEEIKAEIGKPKFEFASLEPDHDMFEAIKAFAEEDVKVALDTDDKRIRDERLKPIYEAVHAKFDEIYPESEALIDECLYKTQKFIVRRWLLDEQKRVDGRGMDDIRPLASEVGVIPRVHGSGMFTRGQTQVLTIATLGPVSDKQLLDGI